jgi:hypothetical protein
LFNRSNVAVPIGQSWIVALQRAFLRRDDHLGSTTRTVRGNLLVDRLLVIATTPLAETKTRKAAEFSSRGTLANVVRILNDLR